MKSMLTLKRIRWMQTGCIMVALLTSCNLQSPSGGSNGGGASKGSESVEKIKPIAAKPGDVIEVNGKDFSETRPLAARFVLPDKSFKDVKMSIRSSTSATFEMPDGLGLGMKSFTVVQGSKEVKSLDLVADSSDNTLPIIIMANENVCSDITYIDRDGAQVTGGKTCTPESHQTCEADGVVGCVTNDNFKAAQVSGLAAIVVSGNTVAGVAGTATSGGSAANCTTNGETGCTTTTAYKAADFTNLIAGNIRSGVTVAGVSGNVAAESHSDCSADGATGCVTTATYKSAVMSNAIAGNIKSGATIAGVSGSVTSESHSDCSADGATGCVTTNLFPAVESSSLAAKVLAGNTVAGVTGTATRSGAGTEALNASAYTVTRNSAPANTTIYGALNISVNKNSSAKFVVIPASGYSINTSATVTSASTPNCTTGGTWSDLPHGAANTSLNSSRAKVYQTAVITADCTVAFDAALAAADSSSSIPLTIGLSPDHKTTWVNTSGGAKTLTVSAPTVLAKAAAATVTPSYTVSPTVAGTCTAGSWSGSDYTTGNDSAANCTVVFTLSASSGVASSTCGTGNATWTEVAEIMTSNLTYNNGTGKSTGGCGDVGCHGRPYRADRYHIGYVGPATGTASVAGGTLPYASLSSMAKLSMYNYVTNGWGVSGASGSTYSATVGTPAPMLLASIMGNILASAITEPCNTTTAGAVPCTFASASTPASASSNYVKSYDPLNSILYRKVTDGYTHGSRMPYSIGTAATSNRALTVIEQDKICNWIWNGAQKDF